MLIGHYETAVGTRNSSSSRANYAAYVVARRGFSSLQFARLGQESGSGLLRLRKKAKNEAVVLHSTEVFFGRSHYEYSYAISHVRTNLVRFLEFTPWECFKWNLLGRSFTHKNFLGQW